MTREYMHPSHLQNRSSKRDNENIPHIKMHLIIQIIPQILGSNSLERDIPNPSDDVLQMRPHLYLYKPLTIQIGQISLMSPWNDSNVQNNKSIGDKPTK